MTIYSNRSFHSRSFCDWLFIALAAEGAILFRIRSAKASRRRDSSSCISTPSHRAIPSFLGVLVWWHVLSVEVGQRAFCGFRWRWARLC